MRMIYVMQSVTSQSIKRMDGINWVGLICVQVQDSAPVHALWRRARICTQCTERTVSGSQQGSLGQMTDKQTPVRSIHDFITGASILIAVIVHVV